VGWNETSLLVEGGRADTVSAWYLRLCSVLGGAWRFLRISAIVPGRWRYAAYVVVARNRNRWFGKVGHCTLLTPEQRTRLL
jgi:predicted DCC family thiol-disulfide oxidoreductase YuxK